MATELKISVIIPVWNGERDIELCLDAISRQTLARELFEVVVVDNGSTDKTAEVAQGYPFTTVIVEHTPGSYAARNAGLAVARGQFVAFTDADCIPEPYWLEAGLAAVSSVPNVGIVAGRVELFRSSADDSETCEAYERLFLLNQEFYVQRGSCATANWFSPRSVLMSLGGFRSDLKSGGDFELTQRVISAGHELHYSPTSCVGHPVRATVADILKKRKRVVGGQWTLKRNSVSALGFASRLVADGAKASLTALRRGPPNLAVRTKLIGLIALVVMAGLREHARLLLGGSARRS